MAVASWRAAASRLGLTKGGRWAWLSTAAPAASSVVDDRRPSVVFVKSTGGLFSLGSPVDAQLFQSPDVQDALVRPVPCRDDDRGATYAAEFALGWLHNAKLDLTRVVSARVLHRGWSIYSVSFEARDPEGGPVSRLYHAHVLNDPATRTKTLFKCGMVDDSFPKPSFSNHISQPPRHSNPVDISKDITDVIVPVDITDDLPSQTKLLRSKFLDDLFDNNIEDCNIRFWRLICASKLGIDNGGVLHFLVVRAKVRAKVTDLISASKLGDDGGEVHHFRSFLAIINLKTRKLFLFRPVDELF